MFELEVSSVVFDGIEEALDGLECKHAPIPENMPCPHHPDGATHWPSPRRASFPLDQPPTEPPAPIVGKRTVVSVVPLLTIREADQPCVPFPGGEYQNPHRQTLTSVDGIAMEFAHTRCDGTGTICGRSVVVRVIGWAENTKLLEVEKA